MNKSNVKKPAMGRGLSSLLGDKKNDIQNVLSSEKMIQLQSISIEKISAGPWQARSVFDIDDLKSLSKSIKENGIIQPLVVTSDKENQGKYFIIAGERRWRAAQLAKVHQIPAIVKDDLSKAKFSEISLLENLQRSDLNPLEEAQGYKNLIEKHKYTQEEVASVAGKSRSYVANIIRLLSLPKKIHHFIIQNKLSVGHVRPLIGREDSVSIANMIVKKDLSVREVELYIKKIDTNDKNRIYFNENDELEKVLSNKTGLKVKIKFNKKFERGSISLFCEDLKQFDYAINKIKLF